MRFSALILPLILSLFGLYCIFSKKDVFDNYSFGGNEGISTAFKIMPTLVLLMSASAMFNESGASKVVSDLLNPIFSAIGVPSELTPLIIIRPISGSGGTALLSDVLVNYGPDSYIGKCASILAASSDTVFYVTALYMSSAKVKKTRYTLPIAIFVMLLGTVISCILPRFTG